MRGPVTGSGPVTATATTTATATATTTATGGSRGVLVLVLVLDLVATSVAGAQAPEAAEPPAKPAPAQPAAQPDAPAAEPPKGPADIINRANAPEAPSRPMPAAAPSTSTSTRGGAPTQAPHPVSPHAGQMMDAPRLATAVPDRLTPPGSIQVTVHDAVGRPVPDADVQLGVMAAGGDREAKAVRSDAGGRARFDGLATGAAAAYRINLLYDGAKVSSMPFRLPEDAGYRVDVTKVPTTRKPQVVFQMIGQVMVELKDDRLHVTQQARLTNAGREVYLFPKGGQFVPLPKGYLSPQFQEVMTDQKLVEKPGEGFLVQGSLSPGTVTLAWGYDLPRDGSEARIVVPVPWRTYMFRAISEAPEGLEMRAVGMPDPQPMLNQGTQLLVTQVQHGPDDAPMKQVILHLSGIPGPGPGRWVAVGFALLALVVAGYVVLRPGEGDALRKRLLGERKERLLDEVRALDAQKNAGDVGPEFYQERLDALVDDLAVVLRDEQLLDQRG